ncbi:MAG: hypothetical protein ACXVEX_12520 [Actinomycetota bacterium]
MSDRSPSADTRRKEPFKVIASVAAWLWIVADGYLMVALNLGSEPAFRKLEFLGHIAFGAMYALPGVLALGARRRPRLLLAAASCGFLLAIGAWSLAPAFLILSLLILWAYIRSPEAHGRRTAPVALICVVLLAAAYWIQIAHADPRCYSFSTDRAGHTTYQVTMGGPSSPGGSQTFTGSGYGFSDGSSYGGGCTSDITTPAEGMASLVIVISIPFVSLAVARETDHALAS